MANNFDENTMNNIKNLVDNGNISEAISQISPEMIENFSKMMNSGNIKNSENTYKKDNTNGVNNSKNTNNAEKSYKTNNSKNHYNSNVSSSQKNSYNSQNSNFDFSKLDMNTILKMKSVMEKINDKNDPRSNLLYSLKPYLRQTRQDKLDQYVNLLNFSKVAEILNNDKKDGKNV